MRLAMAAGLLSAAIMLAGPAAAQENLDAGKSGAQLYASNCAICHKSPQALNKSGGGLFGLDSFLREHYTSGRESAAAISAYLKTVGGGGADRPAAKKKVRTDKRKTKPDAKDDKPESKPDDKKTDDKKPEQKSGPKPTDKKPEKKQEKKEGGNAAHMTGAAVRG
jgi:hypothetical protein